MQLRPQVQQGTEVLPPLVVRLLRRRRGRGQQERGRQRRRGRISTRC
jgi:hypothetical protein